MIINPTFPDDFWGETGLPCSASPRSIHPPVAESSDPLMPPASQRPMAPPGPKKNTTGG